MCRLGVPACIGRSASKARGCMLWCVRSCASLLQGRLLRLLWQLLGAALSSRNYEGLAEHGPIRVAGPAAQN